MKTSGKPIVSMPPMSMEECKALQFEGLDFVYISGDAYVDHPSFGTAIIARVLQKNGYSVGIIAQPDWHNVDEFRRLGKPRLAFLVSSGNIDSMVNHYTASKRKRSEDAYTEGGKAGKRPDRAVIVYANRCKEAYSGVPVVIGGIEASLRRFAHYDYWDNKVRHSILYDACADLLLYGMGERSIVELADALDAGRPISEITDIRGSCYRTTQLLEGLEYELLPSYMDVARDKATYSKAFMMQFAEQDAIRGKRLVQQHEKGYLVANPPALPLSTREMDAVYALPFSRTPHPSYTGHIPALDEVEFSITSARGCFGGCNFCALTFHQGRVIQARSHDSIIREATHMTQSKRFKGYISDVGGPTANFRQPACKKQKTLGTCKDKQCIGYNKCKNLEVSHEDYIQLLNELKEIPRVKKVFVRSGVRYDYVMYDRSDEFLRTLIADHISGQLKIAPEHVSDNVLYYMNKPPHEMYERFMQRYTQLNKNQGIRQYTVPYLMSSHPGCRLEDAVQLTIFLKEHDMRPQQVQDFYPTPGTMSTCMYYTGMDPRTGERIYVPFTEQDKQMQRALMQYYLPQNFDLVRKALKLCNRDDLIGYDKNALVPPKRESNTRQKPIDKRRRNR
ncbi:MAG: YgiQ family radical SAM protein [Eubacteriales bacterium]|nr:YgiQ family radical SAM protein [Eubacteriales bacterium]